MLRFRTALVSLVAALLLAACTSRPDTGTVEREVRAFLTGGGYGKVYEVVRLEKTNGIPRDANTYDAVVSYDLRFRLGMADAAQAFQANSGSIFAAGAAVAELAAEYGPFQAGDVVHRERQVRFMRTENGWRIDGPAKSMLVPRG